MLRCFDGLARLGAGLTLSLLIAQQPAHAHVSGFTDTSIQVAATGVRIIYTLPRDNLLELLPAGATKPDAFKAQDFLPSVREGWSVASGGSRCLLVQASAQLLSTVDSAQFQLSYVCPQGLDQLQIGYQLFFARWADHENFARVFMAGQRNRLRFTSEHRETTVPVAKLLAQWGQPLSAGFFDQDPHRALQAGGEGLSEQPGALPRIVVPQPSLGSLRQLDLGSIDPGFVRMGAEHIFAGLDHVLFVLGLVMMTRAWRQLLVLVSTFTVAHSVTMALSTLDLIRFSPALAEPLIALTIVYIGLENLWLLRQQAPATTSPLSLWRVGLVFAFGLVHGVGFSYTLREMGLREDLLGSLLFFNGGVELGQLAIIALSLPLLTLVQRLRWGRGLRLALSAGVALAGTTMLIGRM